MKRSVRTISAVSLVILTLGLTNPIPAHAQSWIDITDADAVSLWMTHIPQLVQQSRPGNIYWSLADDIAIDGVMKTSAEIQADLEQIVAASMYRVTQRTPIITGPFANRLGPFHDFDLEVTNTSFVGDSCTVSCIYSLRITGERIAQGEVHLGRISWIHWRITGIDGLFPLLRSEMNAKLTQLSTPPKKK